MNADDKRTKSIKSNKSLYAFLIAASVVLVSVIIVVVTLINGKDNNENGSEEVFQEEHVIDSDSNADDSGKVLHASTDASDATNDLDSNNKSNELSSEEPEILEEKDIVEKALEYREGEISSDDFVFEAAKRALSVEEEKIIYNQYAEALAHICEGQKWIDDPSETEYDYLGCWNYFDAEIKDTNNFSIYDVDNDGIDELVVEINNASAADKITVIYQYDISTNKFIREASFYPGAEFYYNDIVFDQWSHNQGVGNFIWPYSVYLYDREQDTYNFICQVDSWNKEIKEEGFPIHKDLDEDGNVVVISKADGIIYLDNKEYYSWIAGITEGTRQKYFDFKPMFNANYREYSKDYVAYILDKEESLDNIDLGITFVKEESPFEVIETQIKDKFDIDFKDAKKKKKSPKQRQAEYDGDKAITLVFDGNPKDKNPNTYISTEAISYEKSIVGVGILGIKPGMDIEKANDILIGRGFSIDDEGNYCIGSAGYHLKISLVNEENVVKSIKICWASAYNVNKK